MYCRGIWLPGCRDRTPLNSVYQLRPSCRRMASCQFFPVAPIVVQYKASMGFSIRRGLAAHGCEDEMVGSKAELQEESPRAGRSQVGKKSTALWVVSVYRCQKLLVPGSFALV